MKTKFVNPFTVAILLTLLSVYIYSLDLAFFQLIELKAYDFKVSSRGERPVSNQVVIVAIDEKSLKQEGRWPWPRTVMARLIDRLAEAGVGAIGLDVLFPEKDTYVPFRDVEKEINKKDLKGLDRKKLVRWLKEVSDSDARLAQSLLRSERSVLGYFIYSAASQVEGSSKPWTDKESKLLEFSQYSVVESNGPDGGLRRVGGRRRASLPVARRHVSDCLHGPQAGRHRGDVRWESAGGHCARAGAVDGYRQKTALRAGLADT